MAGSRSVAKPEAASSTTMKKQANSSAIGAEVVAKQLYRDVNSINAQLYEMANFWAKALGVSGPQWMILVAIADLDRGPGVPLNLVSSALHVGHSFVTTQSKFLEKNGFVKRAASSDDARVVLVSLTARAGKEVNRLLGRQEEVNKFIFAEFDDGSLRNFAQKIGDLKVRFQKALLKLANDI
jgi:DNA-binding MarR family transcriptional regulator